MATWVMIIVASMGTQDRGAAVYNVGGFRSAEACNQAIAGTVADLNAVFGKYAGSLARARCTPQ